jgi:hypothetical protein
MPKQQEESIQDVSKRDVMAFLYSLAYVHGFHAGGGASRVTMAHPLAVAEQCYLLADAMIQHGKES